MILASPSGSTPRPSADDHCLGGIGSEVAIGVVELEEQLGLGNSAAPGQPEDWLS